MTFQFNLFIEFAVGKGFKLMDLIHVFIIKKNTFGFI